MQNEEKIRAAIAAYFKKNTFKNGIFTEFEDAHLAKDYFCGKHAAEIMSAIRPHLQPQDLPCDKLFDHMANEHDLILTNTELGDIIHICRK